MDAIIIPLDPRQRNAWIRYALHLRGTSFAQIARDVGISRHTARQALDRPYPKMEAVIAARIGVPPARIWPERYDAQGRTLHGRGKRRKGFHGSQTTTLGAPGRNGKDGGVS